MNNSNNILLNISIKIHQVVEWIAILPYSSLNTNQILLDQWVSYQKHKTIFSNSNNNSSNNSNYNNNSNNNSNNNNFRCSNNNNNIKINNKPYHNSLHNLNNAHLLINPIFLPQKENNTIRIVINFMVIQMHLMVI